MADRQPTLILETERIIFPRRSGFYELQIKRTATEDILISTRLQNEQTDELLFSKQAEGTVRRRLDYIGNDYVSLCETYADPFLAGSEQEKSILKIVAVDSLPATPAVTMDDLLGNKNLNMVTESTDSDGKEENFGLARRKGYWIFQGRSFSDQEGREKFIDFPLSIIPPDHLVISNELAIPWPRVKNMFPKPGTF